MLIHSSQLKSILEYRLEDIKKLCPEVYTKLSFDSRRLGMHIRKYAYQYYRLLYKKQLIVDLSRSNY